MKRLVSAILVSMLMLTAVGGILANAETVPPFDYSSFIGIWEAEFDGDFSRRINILNVSGNYITFEFEDPGGIWGGRLPVVDNRVVVAEDYWFTFYDDSIVRRSRGFESRFMSQTATPRRIVTGDFSVELNGVRLEFDQPPLMVNERILVPMRAIFEALGMSVEFEVRNFTELDGRGDEYAEFRTQFEEISITARHRDTRLLLMRNSQFRRAERYGELVSGYQAWINHTFERGEQVGWFYFPAEGETPPVIVNDRTLVPVRFIAESLGATIDWNGATQTVIIETDEYF